jgi:hypothetical protein
MDPDLWELYESGPPDEEVSVILRLREGAAPPANLRVVARFGEEIATARLRRSEIRETHDAPGVLSLKASRAVRPSPPLEEVPEATPADELAPAPVGPALRPVPEDGTGVVVGICDWGFDFTHANFRHDDGSTRLQALWDQRGGAGPRSPAPYGHGRLLRPSDIDAALAQPDPCAALQYYPHDGDPGGMSGSHGTHVSDILAGNRREPGSEVGLASGADIVFVHLASQRQGELDNLGDSVGLLEGLDFVRRQAAGRPCVMHLSAGKTGGPHLGTTLLERAVDAMLLESPGLVLVQSVGNYADTAMHTQARVGPNQRHVLGWLIPEGDRTPNELEIWYSGQDVFDLTVISPDGREFSVALDDRLRLVDGPDRWGNVYHRRNEPNSGLNHIVVFLYTTAPPGQWQVVIRGRDVVDGRLHAWIERDAGRDNQSRFPRAQATSRYTTNTICNCFRAIAVGAYDATRPDRPPARFSSRGPTADGRQKPEVAAPGYQIRAARSRPITGWRPGDARLCVKSGTSMAAPWVSGTVALVMQAAGRPLTIHEIRRVLIGSADELPGPAGRSSTRLGYGYLDIPAAVAAARQLRLQAVAPAAGATSSPPSLREELEEHERAGHASVWAEPASSPTVERQPAPSAPDEALELFADEAAGPRDDVPADLEFTDLREALDAREERDW